MSGSIWRPAFLNDALVAAAKFESPAFWYGTFFAAPDGPATGVAGEAGGESSLEESSANTLAKPPTKAPKNQGAGGAAFFALGTAGFGAGCRTSSWSSGPS